ncbi:MAG: glycosyltransferase family 4 protein [Planctomycetota bacterium]
MKVLLVARPLELRGATLYTLTVARELRLRGHQVATLSEGGDFEQELVAERIPLLRAPLRGHHWRDTVAFVTHLRLARRYAPDLLHIQEEALARHAVWLSAWLHLPHVLTCHNVPPAPLRPSPWRRGVIATTPHVARQLIKTSGVPEDQIEQIPMGVAIDRTVHETIERALPVVPIIGTTGRLDGSPDLSLLVQAARKLLDREVAAHFAIVGAGPQEGALRRQIRELDLVDCVTVSMAQARIADLLDPIDVYVSTGGEEALPALTLLAMSRGKPVIALPSPALPETLRDGETVLVPADRSPESVADAVARMLETRGLREMLARQGLDMVARSHGRREMVERTLRCYREAQDREE